VKMKKIIFTILCLFALASTVDAQYKINKTKYDYQEYVFQPGDKYVVGLAGVASFVIPGLGQIVCNEVIRGIGFFAGYCAGWGLFINGYGTFWYSGEAGGTLLGLAIAIGMDICSTVDAVRVAKVNNLAFRDKNNLAYNFSISPYIDPAAIPISGKPITGLSLSFKF